MNEAWIWQYIFLGEGGGWSLHDVDIILGGVVTKWCLITMGGGVKNLGKSEYIISKLSLCNFKLL